jgi:hypothetical protein
MDRSVRSFEASIPAAYTNSAFPVQYYFELRKGDDSACLYPVFNRVFASQPYLVLLKALTNVRRSHCNTGIEQH